MLTIFDHLLVSVLAIAWPLYAAIVQFPRLKRGLSAGLPGIRSRTYVRAIAVQWSIAAYTLTVWILARRPAADLGFGDQRAWQLIVGVIAVAAAAVFLEVQRRSVTRDPALQIQFRKKIENALPILPTDAKELFLFHLLSVTAGVCEELLYRGFLIWYIAEGLGLGLVVAVALSSLLFGLAHLYQGVKGIVQTGAVGLIFALLYVATGSLWAPMLLHALVDMNSGVLWYQVRGSGGTPETTLETHEANDTGAANEGVGEP